MSADVNSVQLFNELNKYSSTGDYTRALKIANKVLNILPQDETAFHCKVICLIHLSRFEDALQSFNKYPKFHKNLLFERAHCMFRLSLNDNALNLLKSATTESISLKELKAQILYRSERFEECYKLYSHVIKSSSDEFDEERLTNLAAVISNLSRYGKKIEMPSFSFDTYEINYNVACYLISRGQFTEAETRLRHAGKLCREMNDDLEADEVEEDSSIIRLQLGYVTQILGKEKEAKMLYNSILIQKVNAAVAAITNNNSITVSNEQSLFDLKKKMKCALMESTQKKLTSYQNRQLGINNCLLLLRAGQVYQAVEYSNDLVQKFPDAQYITILAKAYGLVQKNKKSEAITMLMDFATKNPKDMYIMLLTVAQLALTDGDIKRACGVLETLAQDDYKLGIVSVLVHLYLEAGKRNEAAKLLHSTVSYHQKNKTERSYLGQLWRKSAELNLKSGEPQIAAESLEEVLKSDPTNIVTLAQLIISYSKINFDKAKYYCTKLSPLIDKAPVIDTRTLEASNWMMGLKVIKKVAKLEHSPCTPKMAVGTKEKKKRKNKLPKAFDPNIPPDPERWLPRHERSNYRKKKDRRHKDIGKGTQGSATSISDQYDITKMAQKVSSSTSLTAESSKMNQGRKSTMFNRKKKRSGK